MDNYVTHKHPRVQAWLKRHPRFVSHFIPTISSWLNLVERWFGDAQWDVVMLHMRVRANLTAEEHKQILVFLKSAH